MEVTKPVGSPVEQPSDTATPTVTVKRQRLQSPPSLVGQPASKTNQVAQAAQQERLDRTATPARDQGKENQETLTRENYERVSWSSAGSVLQHL